MFHLGQMNVKTASSVKLCTYIILKLKHPTEGTWGKGRLNPNTQFITLLHSVSENLWTSLIFWIEWQWVKLPTQTLKTKNKSNQTWSRLTKYPNSKSRFSTVSNHYTQHSPADWVCLVVKETQYWHRKSGAVNDVIHNGFWPSCPCQHKN